MEQCPRCKSPHDTLNGVVQHAVKSQDEAHQDVSTVSDGIRLVAGHCKTTAENADEATVNHSDSTVESTADSTVTDTVNEAVTDGGTAGFMPADARPAGDGGTPDEAEGDGCPDCGHADFYSSTELLRTETWAADTAAELREHDRVCTDCGEIYG